MKRLLEPVGCGGGCNQGRTTCDCELANSVPPDASRTFAPAPPAPRARRRWLAVLSVALVAGGLWVFFASARAEFPALNVLMGPR